ncbi:hypothetical protein TUMEXPCC7403_18560 [Tumidithrix helvetica PCC 7403]|uniref:hypothetical protein n=1 Tax=Tumidithrix helvetica TaxID=3457545 RepID=UPI003CAE7A07
MAYSSFSLRDVEKDFSLTIEEEINLFASTESLPQSDVLRQTFAENVSLALAINTEKARSELIVMPLLLEVRRRSPSNSQREGIKYPIADRGYLLSHHRAG